MNEHAGPACALSGLIVGIFAILLHDNTPPPPSPKAVASTRAGESSKPDAPGLPRPIQAVGASPSPLVKGPVVAAREVQVAVAGPPRPPAPGVQPELAAPTRPPKKPRPSPPSPRPSFAIVGDGESLADVAARVYGSEDAAEALWKANRDQVERIDSPLARGTLLRVP